jgi:hypothetical protein
VWLGWIASSRDALLAMTIWLTCALPNEESRFMSETQAGLLVIAWMGTSALAICLCGIVMNRLQARHKRIYDSLEKPTLVYSEQTDDLVIGNVQFIKYIGLRKYRAIDDKYIKLLCDTALAAIFISTVLTPCVIICILFKSFILR